ncbi:MAG: hypothetical protein ACI4MQ_05670 [Candidatus Coproplasma sp.]
MKGKYSSKFKKAAFGLTAIATSLLIGMTAACASNSSTDDEEDKVTTKEDLQDIKNGNFEFYDDNEGLYPISTPDNWSFSYSGTSSSSMSGIIKTSKEGWAYLTDPTLPETLEANDDLDSDDENKKDYNGALSDDMLYKNMHDALDDDEADDDAEDKKAYIANPNTHNLRWDEETEKYVYVDENGQVAEVYTDEDGKVYADADHKNEIGTSVLMLHNYRKNYFRGNEGYYESSTTISLEANTTCKISLWVKTAELYCDNSKGERSEVTFNKGAYIKVDSSVGGNSLDSFTIKNINTEVLNPDTVDGDGNVTAAAENNGWVQYTVYVQASSFATTTVSLTLGLGENGSKGINTVEGYAFFDDITFEKYRNIDLLKDANSDFDTAIRATDAGDQLTNTCYPLAADANMTFRVDEPKNKTEDSSGNVIDNIEPNNSQDRKFFINFASTQANTVTLNSSNVKSGLTVDANKYISSKNEGYKVSGVGTLDNGASTAKLPSNIKNNGLTVSSDLLALTDINSDWVLNLSGFDYNTLLTDSLKSASKLPDVNGSAKTLIMLSANGAAYETRITDDTATFKIDDGEYKLISFWLKTSDFNDKTAATISVYDTADDSNVSNYSLDTTEQSTINFGDEKDIYNGWVRCFIRVGNTSGEDGKTFGIKINLGNTSIKGTTATDYKYGWLAVANLTIMELDEDVYGYTSNLDNVAELSYTETTDTFSKEFDSEQGGTNNQIKTDLATPSSYTGANGNSVSVKPTGSAATDYDTTNNNDYAGLLNKENLDNYKDKDWYSKICSDLPGSFTNDQIWESIAGKYTYQPLLIVNAVRNLKDSSKVYNYGYIGNTSTISSDSYSKVSVRVKVSSGAIAYVYLIDTDSENNDVLTYKTPEVNFFYDDNGNILKTVEGSEDKEIAYILRDDGLYENGDGKLYANFYNLTKYYDYRYEHENFFDAEGNAVTFENLVTGATYYADANKTKLAPHHLIAGGKENNKVYEYAGEVDGKSTYYYMENGVANKDKVVNGVDKSIASYTYDPSTATPYSFVIDCREPGSVYEDKWVTVTFNVHTGSVAKNYRLELWAGERDKETTENVATDSYVLFDYSPESATSLDSSTYESKLGYYTDAIRADLIENIDGELPDNDQSIAQLEKLVNSTYTNIYNYSATYYTFSLYDSPSFIPFNAGTAEEGQTGYDYLYSNYEEALGFLKVVDTDDSDNLSMTAFVDYSLTDKEFEIIGEPTVDTGDDEDTDTTNTDSANVWLLIASIAIVVAILVAIVAILIKQLRSKYGKVRKSVGKNTYNFNKNKRYVKKYVKANGEAPEATADVESEVDEQATKTPVEEQSTSAETREEVTSETPVNDQTPSPEEKTADENGDGEDKKPE